MTSLGWESEPVDVGTGRGRCETVTMRGVGRMDVSPWLVLVAGIVLGGCRLSFPPAVDVCGDGRVGSSEECDDGNAEAGDGCSGECEIEPGWTCSGAPSICEQSCGNGEIGSGEACDDGNQASGDGCSENCEIEDGWTCSGMPSVCEKNCGNGRIDPGEDCDDGSGNSDILPDACRTNCRMASCGDGVTDSGEECDDGAGNSDSEPDACRSNCLQPVCGDGVVDMGEECDDGGRAGRYDGCTMDCIITDFQGNSHVDSDQIEPSVAMAADGRFVVVWKSNGQDGAQGGIYAQRYDASGFRVGEEFLVNTFTPSEQEKPSVAMSNLGRFVIVWGSYGHEDDSSGIYAQRFSAAGEPLGEEFRVNSYTASYQYLPSVAMAEDESFVVVWQSNAQDGSDYGVYGQRYDALGEAAGEEFQVNSYTDLDQKVPSVAMSNDGRFVVVWESDGQDGSHFGIYGRLYDAAGQPGEEFLVNQSTQANQWQPSVDMAGDGGFVVVWESFEQDGSDTGIFARRYDASGNPLGDEFQVNRFVENYQQAPAVAMMPEGQFVVVWQSNAQDGSDYGVYAQRFHASGDPAGQEFQVNVYTELRQELPAVAAAADGRFVILWQSDGQDGDRDGIFGKLYSSEGLPCGPGNW